MNNKNALILIVDDNTRNLQVLGSFLSEKSYKTAIAKNGKEALAFLNKRIPELILMDIMMPEMDGFEACKAIKDIDILKDIPILFISALSETEDKVKALEIGGVDFISKPFQKEEVFARVNTHILLHRQRKELNELNTTKDKFFSIIAHDLRGPIGGLMNMSKLLFDEYDTFDDEERTDFLNELKKTSKNIYELLENLLMWSRSQRGKLEFSPQKLDLEMIADKIISLLKISADKKSINLISEFPNDSFIYADPNMLNTIIRNLVANAIKFTPEDGEIKIGQRLSDDRTEIIISDNGVGMNQESIDKIFKLDTHYTTIGTSGEKGTGLGLMLCKEFAERHNGDLTVESEIGKGSEFKIVLPFQKNSSNDRL